MIYNKKIKKILPKRPATAYGQFLKDRKGIKVPKGEKPLLTGVQYSINCPKIKRKNMKKKPEKIEIDMNVKWLNSKMLFSICPKDHLMLLAYSLKIEFLI